MAVFWRWDIGPAPVLDMSYSLGALVARKPDFKVQGWPSIAGTILFNRLLVPRFLGGAPDEAAIAAALPRARLCLAEIDRLMEGYRFLAGDHVSLADLMVIPLLWYFGDVADGRAPMAE